MKFALRVATEADAEAVTHVHQLSRAAYYGSLLPLADPSADRLPMWRDVLRDPASHALIAETDHALVGFVCMRRVESVDDDVAELTSLYVAPAHFGTGIGDALHSAFLEWARGSAAVLEVWDDNERAKRFYRRRGWTPTSTMRPGVNGTPFVIWRREHQVSV